MKLTIYGGGYISKGENRCDDCLRAKVCYRLRDLARSMEGITTEFECPDFREMPGDKRVDKALILQETPRGTWEVSDVTDGEPTTPPPFSRGILAENFGEAVETLINGYSAETIELTVIKHTPE